MKPFIPSGAPAQSPKPAGGRAAGLPGPPPGRLKLRLRPVPKRKLRVHDVFAVPAAQSPAPPIVVPARQPAAAPAVPAVPLPATSPVAAPVAAEPANAFTLRGEFWDIKYAGLSALFEDSRGLRYISLLIQNAQSEARPMHAKELTALATGRAPSAIELESKEYVLDRVARQQLFDRLAQLVDERDLACAAEDFEKAAALDAEHERIADEHSQHGARGAFSHEGEKARKAVGKAISEAIARIGANASLAPLAEHLTSAIHKGQWLSYNGHVDWHVDFRPPLPRK